MRRKYMATGMSKKMPNWTMAAPPEPDEVVSAMIEVTYMVSR
jgi:hypothetical protein